jgi:hypothetical protein
MVGRCVSSVRRWWGAGMRGGPDRWDRVVFWLAGFARGALVAAKNSDGTLRRREKFGLGPRACVVCPFRNWYGGAKNSDGILRRREKFGCSEPGLKAFNSLCTTQIKGGCMLRVFENIF